jgi:hypothetical protein
VLGARQEIAEMGSAVVPAMGKHKESPSKWLCVGGSPMDRVIGILCIGSLLGLAIVDTSLKSTAQMLVVPLVLLAAWRLRIFSVRIPRLVVLFAGCGALMGAFLQSSHVALSRGGFLVATVSKADLRQETKIYRDRIRRSIGTRGEMLVGLYNGDIYNTEQAAKLLRSSPQLGGVIWGDERSMTASLQQLPDVALSSFPDGSVAREILEKGRVADLLIVSSIPSVSVSNGHEKATVHFLGALIQLWRDTSTVMTPGHDKPDYEGMAYSLARTQARWTSRVHMAVPMWLAGTRHLVRAIEKSDIEVGELSCAITKLREALAQFRAQDNPALAAAVRNNYSLALLVQAHYEGNTKKLQAKARKQIGAAMRLRAKTGRVGASVSHNRYALIMARKSQRMAKVRVKSR